VKNYRIFFLTFIFALAFVGRVFAEGTPALKVAYVDIGKVFDEYSKTKDYDKELESKYGAYEKEHNDKLNKIKANQDKLSLLKDEEKNKMQTQIDKDKSDLMDFDRQKQTELRKARDEKVRELLGEIEKVIKDYATEQKYTLVLNDKVLVYVDKGYEITDPIIKKLNEKNGGQSK